MNHMRAEVYPVFDLVGVRGDVLEELPTFFLHITGYGRSGFLMRRRISLDGDD